MEFDTTDCIGDITIEDGELAVRWLVNDAFISLDVALRATVDSNMGQPIGWGSLHKVAAYPLSEKVHQARASQLHTGLPLQHELVTGRAETALAVQSLAYYVAIERRKIHGRHLERNMIHPPLLAAAEAMLERIDESAACRAAGVVVVLPPPRPPRPGMLGLMDRLFPEPA